ncbi:MAG: GNAT family N-acetyltransferase [Acidobacteria bacterium]|nr:GNAT family N-acetyltransferase [Acidobacteriota bacterium]
MEFGYLHANYARAFTAFGSACYLPASQGWILKRAIPGSNLCDAMGCYPLFACRNWPKLAEDLPQLAEDLVSLTIVTDPLGGYELADLRTAFPDLMRPFKEHFIVDLQQPLSESISAHHRRNIRQALSQVGVERCAPSTAFDEWVTLYNHLIQRHEITGIAAFSRASFAAQWQVPGLTVFRALHQGETVGMTLWYQEEDRVYYHLAAYSPRGYELKASYALFHQAIEYFSCTGVRWMALGAGAGIHNDGSDGLTRFKRGWATETRPVYLCGRIFNPQAYALLAEASDAHNSSFFPAYRQPAATAHLVRRHVA